MATTEWVSVLPIFLHTRSWHTSPHFLQARHAATLPYTRSSQVSFLMPSGEAQHRHLHTLGGTDQTPR